MNVPKLTLFDELAIMDRISILRMQYTKTAGKLPTRLVMPPDDFAELTFWLHTNDEPAYLAPPEVPEPELFGMLLRIEEYAKNMRVYFQES